MADLLIEAPDHLSEADLDEELGMTPLSESAGAGPAELLEGSAARLVVPKKGKIFDENGLCEIVVIRPCVSRGKRIRGLPPIYTPSMLESNATVYTGWLQYMDHLTEKIVEELLKEGRSIKDLGGRIIKSWWDPSVRFTDDAKYGFQPGGVVAQALPQPKVREMLEADPEILNVSHNAWPTGAKKAKAPWDSNLEGYLIEGIRPTPEGSVDWVPRGGAGGRVRLQEWETFAVSVLGSGYGSSRREDEPLKETTDTMPDLKNLNRDSLVEALRKENPDLLEALSLTDPKPAKPAATGALTMEELREALQEQEKTFEQKLQEAQTSAEKRAEELAQGMVQERAQASEVSGAAQKLIKASGLPSRWQEDLIRRYAVLPSGPSTALTSVMEEDDVEQALRESVEEDVKHARQLIEDAGGVPQVTGLGGTAQQTRVSEARTRRSRGAFREFLAQSNDGKDVDDDTIQEMVREGVSA
jgi:hypothetical protein